MTSPDLRGPRHAASASSTSVAPPAPVDTPTQTLPVVIPAQRTQEVIPSAPAGDDSRPDAIPVHFPTLRPTPPAGLPVNHPPVPERSGWRIALVAVVGTLLLFGLMVAAGLAITSTDREPLTGTSGAPPAVSSTPQQELAQWALGGGTARTRAITDDLNAVSDAASRYDVAGMNTACRSLQSTIEAAQAYDPVPDAQAQGSWSSALAHGARSATYCIAGTESMSALLIESATSEISDMTTDLNRTTDRINAINSGI